MHKRLLVLALAAMLSPTAWGGTVIVDDHFNDGAIGTNTTGIGTGFNTVSLTGGSVTESDSSVHLNNTTNGAARAAIASKDGIALGTGVARFEFQGISFARNAGNTGTGTTGRTAVGVRGDSTAEDVDTAVANGFWIQFESGDIGENNASWSGASTLFYESSAHVKTVLATWKFNTLNWDDNNPATMNFTPVLDITLDLTLTGYSLTIKGDTISSVTGSLAGSYASAGITNELTTGYAFAFNQGEAPGLDMSIDRIVIMFASLELASLPSPANGAQDLHPDVVLGWTPGQYAGTHNIYLGTSFNDVNDATTSSPLLVSKNQDANSYDSPGRLDFGTTYYWRVDEVNAPPSSTIFKGVVWNFTTEPLAYKVPAVTATASSAGATAPAVNTVNGSGLVGDQHGTDPKTMWLSASTGLPAWIQYDFDQVYKLYEMLVWNHNTSFESLLGFGAKDATVEYSSDGTTWTKLGDFELAQAPGTDNLLPTSTLSFGGVAAKSVRLTISSSWMQSKQAGLAEVRFLYIPVAAREPVPATGSTGIDPTTAVFSWRAGREAVSHNIYVGTDADAVQAGTTPTGTSSTTSYTPPGLQLSTTYYWRVDEVNTAEVFSTWAGPVWSFSTPDFVMVDDFEAYTDETPSRIFDAWLDGYGTTTNGAMVGNAVAPFAERSIIHGGRQSMPFSYNNTGSFTLSEATLPFPNAKDWTAAGIKTLVLFFRGASGNATGQLYVKINNTKVTYPGDAAILAASIWKQWNIDLTAIGGVKTVNSLTIGMTGSGSGLLYFDDIRLYAAAPAVPVPTDPGATNLVSYFPFEGDAKDSKGAYNGTLNDMTFVNSMAGFGKAAQFNGTTGYIDLGASFATLLGSLTSSTLTAWVNYTGSTGNWQRVFDLGKDTNTYVFMTTRTAAGVPRFAITTTSSGGESGVTATQALSLGWHQLAGVLDASAMTISLYVDGTLEGTAATTKLPKDLGATTNNWLGRSQWSGDAYLSGALDDFRIYNRTLTDGEVRYLAGDR
jgi:hypothetical protein